MKNYPRKTCDDLLIIATKIVDGIVGIPEIMEFGIEGIFNYEAKVPHETKQYIFQTAELLEKLLYND